MKLFMIILSCFIFLFSIIGCIVSPTGTTQNKKWYSFLRRNEFSKFDKKFLNSTYVLILILIIIYVISTLVVILAGVSVLSMPSLTILPLAISFMVNTLTLRIKSVIESMTFNERIAISFKRIGFMILAIFLASIMFYYQDQFIPTINQTPAWIANCIFFYLIIYHSIYQSLKTYRQAIKRINIITENPDQHNDLNI